MSMTGGHESPKDNETPLPANPMESVNAQHMRNAGLDPETLGKPAPPRTGGDPLKRCPSVHGTSMCAREVGHPGVHARGGEHWGDEEAATPTRASGNREGDQVLPTGDESWEDDQTLIANTLRQLAEDVEERRRLGIERYGQGHRPFNGRNTIQDAYDEGVDQTVYLGSLIRARQAQRIDLIPIVAKDIEGFIGELFQGDTGSKVCIEIAESVVDRLLDYVTVKIEEG